MQSNKLDYQEQIKKREKELRQAFKQLQRLQKPEDRQERQKLKKRMKKLVATLQDVKFRAASLI